MIEPPQQPGHRVEELGADGETSFVYPPLLRCDVRY
jgi:hypothetical protein